MRCRQTSQEADESLAADWSLQAAHKGVELSILHPSHLPCDEPSSRPATNPLGGGASLLRGRDAALALALSALGPLVCETLRAPIICDVKSTDIMAEGKYDEDPLSGVRAGRPDSVMFAAEKRRCGPFSGPGRTNSSET
jgi:hypothetical protein